jgi:AcrR family transcriptional regulator
MARPKSKDKRNAILAAAIQVIAEQGVGAPTAKIAQLAGVAEGTLFTYFNTKDELLNQIYLDLKTELREAVSAGYPKDEILKNRVRHTWQAYVDWGVRSPQKRKVLAQLAVSERISAETKAATTRAFADINAMVEVSTGDGALRKLPPAFVSAILSSLAETTMEFMARDPRQAKRYIESGFEAFWNAVTH